VKVRERNSAQVDEAGLVARLRQQDNRAIEILYDNYSSALYGVILRILKQEDLAEDVLQETFIKVWRNIASYDETKGRLFTWLVRIARNLALDRLKSRDFRNTQQNQNLDDVVTLVDDRMTSDQQVDAIGLGRILEGLKPEQQVLVDLIYFQGYTQAEASEELRIPLGTVKTRMRAAISTLRGIFSSNEKLL
jgi:RNA polymerase sigma-70 factor, ECF subfamily